ncbi:MAG: Asp23/Gls24 family envelope stress response protein [Glaciihabitans sp.]|nr:Asp23/Gls24 family envelope stress response protein [Glaciihabitans sp.]
MTNAAATPASTSTSRSNASATNLVDPAVSTPTNIQTAQGKTVINDGVVAKVAGIAAREVPGVYALGGGAARAIGAIRQAMKNTDLSQGITVEVGETQVAVDVTIVAEYPVPLQQVADDVRASVIAAIETLIGMEVTEVNVTIIDVFIPSDDDTDAEPAEARVL